MDRKILKNNKDIYSLIRETQFEEYMQEKSKIEIMHTKPESKVYRIMFNNIDAEIKSIIIKINQKTAEREYRILTYLQKQRFNVPLIYHYNNKKQMLFLQDLGNKNLEYEFKKDKNMYKRAIEQLAHIHCNGLENWHDLISTLPELNKKMNLPDLIDHLKQINTKRIFDLIGDQISTLHKKELYENIAKLVSYIFFNNRSNYDNRIKSELIVKDLKPHHFIISNNKLYIIDIEIMSFNSIPQDDLVSLLEHPLNGFSNDEKKELLIYYIEYRRKLKHPIKNVINFYKTYYFYCLQYIIFYAFASIKKFELKKNLLEYILSSIVYDDEILNRIKNIIMHYYIEK